MDAIIFFVHPADAEGFVALFGEQHFFYRGIVQRVAGEDVASELLDAEVGGILSAQPKCDDLEGEFAHAEIKLKDFGLFRHIVEEFAERDGACIFFPIRQRLGRL